MRRPWMLVALLFALAAAPASRAEGDAETASSEDPRIARAGALLDSKEDWPRAIELYEAVLADHPENATARLWAARVHAWQGDYEAAFRHFDALLALPQPPASAAIERAEVLSWAGRSEEAEQAFEAILERNPEDARALRGLARTYRWSGQLSRADRAYERALRVEEDEKLRAELTEMRRGPRWTAENESSYFADSDRFQRVRIDNILTHKLDYDTSLRGHLRYMQVEVDRRDGPPPAGVDRNHDSSFMGTVGVERRFPHRLRAAVDVGGIEWKDAADRFTGRAELGWTAPTGSSLGLSVGYGDLIAYTGSVNSVERGYSSTALRASIWQPWNEAWSSYAAGEIAFFSGNNTRRSAGASLDYQPWKAHDLLFSLGVDWLSYSDNTAYYYDPEKDVSVALAARYRRDLGGGFEAWLRPSLGYGYAEQDNNPGQGLNVSVEGGPRWKHSSGFWIGLQGHYSRAQRSNPYETHGGSVSVGRDF